MIVPLYLLTLLVLSVYSYSQIDLNLTLLQTPWFLEFQKTMVNLGYFNRQTSTVIFISVISLLSVFYILLAKKSTPLSSGSLKILFTGIVVLTLLSYPGFSHDIFNYIFDARILLTHHGNPYTATALMYPADTWTRFMNWTHRTYPYGPTFLPITLPFYMIGFGKFIPTLLSFKILMTLAYLSCCYFLSKLAKTREVLLFALNPLVIIEGLISGHLDIVMLAFALSAIHFASKNRKWLSVITLMISIGVKYITALFLPVFLFWPKLSASRRYYSLALLALIGAIAQIFGREVLPHYFLTFFGFAVLTPNKKYTTYFLAGVSFFLLLIRYVPYFFTGTWLTLRFFLTK